MSDLLFFNGVNGAQGTYGLQPMTAESLSDRILNAQFAESKKLEELEAKLKKETANKKKILQIVELLAQRTVQDPGEAVPQSEWLETLTEELFALLADDKRPEPGLVQELANKLKRDTVGVIGSITWLLSENNGQELSALLLDKPDNQTLKEKLKDDTEHKIIDIQKRRLGEDNVRALESGDAALRNNWLRTLTQELKALQIESLKALTSVEGTEGIITEPLDTLIGALKALSEEARGSQDGWLATLTTELTDLRTQGDRTPWNDLVDSVEAGLGVPITNAGDQVPWSSLLKALYEWLGALRKKIAHLGAVEWVDATRLDQAGWGIIFSAKMEAGRREAIKKALEPLLRWRLLQTDFQGLGIKDSYYEEELSRLLALRDDNDSHAKYQAYFKIYEGKDGYRPNDTADKFLKRHDARASDPADPKKVPYYLLVVGSPEEIPFLFQYQLDVQYAVGRIDFGDDTAAYENYARNVVAAEQKDFAQAAKLTLFGVRNPDDRATELSAQHLIQPLHEHFSEKSLDVEWQIDRIPPEEATKARLLSLLKDKEPPAFLLTASHGVEFDSDDPEGRQARHQGALLCSDWPGPDAWRGEIPAAHYLSGDDIRENADAINLKGMIAFFFACFGAGTPRYDEYYKQEFKEKGKIITEHPFVADLPKAMLSLRQGGALAVVGHVERAWGTSFLGDQASRTSKMKSRKSEYVAVFESAIERLLKGHPIGDAMDYFNVRYAALSTELTVIYDAFGDPDPYELAELWTANNDARGYIIVGDPAVRLRAASG